LPAMVERQAKLREAIDAIVADLEGEPSKANA